MNNCAKLITAKDFEKNIRVRAKKEKAQAESELLESFRYWFNDMTEHVDVSNYLASSYFTISRNAIPDDFVSIPANKDNVFKPIITKYLKDNGWDCEEDNVWWIKVQPIRKNNDDKSK